MLAYELSCLRAGVPTRFGRALGVALVLATVIAGYAAPSYFTGAW